MDSSRALLKHFLAAIAYRTQKALRGAAESFSGFRAGNNTRTPHELLWHMTSVLGYLRAYLLAGTYRPDKLASFDDEIRRFHDVLEDLARLLDEPPQVREISPEQMLHGPLAD